MSSTPETMRPTLKVHDAQKTSALLKRLQIEDPSAVEDATANIPASLIDESRRLVMPDTKSPFRLLISNHCKGLHWE